MNSAQRSPSPLHLRRSDPSLQAGIRPSAAQTTAAVQAAKAAQHLAEHRAQAAEQELRTLRLEAQVAPDLRASAIVDALRNASAAGHGSEDGHAARTSSRPPRSQSASKRSRHGSKPTAAGSLHASVGSQGL